MLKQKAVSLYLVHRLSFPIMFSLISFYQIIQIDIEPAKINMAFQKGG